MALSADKSVPQMGPTGRLWELPVLADEAIYVGALVCVNQDDNFAIAAAVDTGLVAVGRAEHAVDATGLANGDVSVQVRDGIFKFENDGTDPVTDLFSACYIVDDETVSSSSDTGARSIAGVVAALDSDGGVWVAINPLDRDVS